MTRIQKKEGFIRTPPNCYGPSSSLSEQTSCPVNFCLPAILGLEMAAPISWAPGMFAFFLQENLRAHNILVLGVGYFGLLGCGECRCEDSSDLSLLRGSWAFLRPLLTLVSTASVLPASQVMDVLFPVYAPLRLCKGKYRSSQLAMLCSETLSSKSQGHCGLRTSLLQLNIIWNK